MKQVKVTPAAVVVRAAGSGVAVAVVYLIASLLLPVREAVKSEPRWQMLGAAIATILLGRLGFSPHLDRRIKLVGVAVLGLAVPFLVSTGAKLPIDMPMVAGVVLFIAFLESQIIRKVRCTVCGSPRFRWEIGPCLGESCDVELCTSCVSPRSLCPDCDYLADRRELRGADRQGARTGAVCGVEGTPERPGDPLELCPGCQEPYHRHCFPDGWCPNPRCKLAQPGKPGAIPPGKRAAMSKMPGLRGVPG